MRQQLDAKYIYLDGQQERRELIRRIVAVRHAVRDHVRTIPEAEWYTPRYHGWTLAGTLAHLNFSDNMSLLTIKLAMMNLRPATSSQMLQRVNNWTARFFRKRLVKVSLHSIGMNQQRIVDFIMGLSMDKFTTRVWDPRQQEFTTIEKALQDFLLYHWQGHLDDMREIEGQG
jgi:hypothetical protein